MFILPKETYRINAILFEIPIPVFFHRNRTKNSKICMEPQKTLNSQNSLEEKQKVGDLMISDFKLYQKTTIIKTI